MGKFRYVPSFLSFFLPPFLLFYLFSPASFLVHISLYKYVRAQIYMHMRVYYLHVPLPLPSFRPSSNAPRRITRLDLCLRASPALPSFCCFAQLHLLPQTVAVVSTKKSWLLLISKRIDRLAQPVVEGFAYWTMRLQSPIAYVPTSSNLKTMGGEPILRIEKSKADPCAADTRNLIILRGS